MVLAPAAYLALAAAGISGTFAALVLRQFAARRKPYQLAWSVGLALFTVASALEFVSWLQGGWEGTLYRVYFGFHPLLVAVLGLGTVYLLADKRVGHGFLLYILGALGVLAYAVATAPVSLADVGPGLVVGGQAMPDGVRSLSQLFTYPGTVALVGGALYSWRKTGGTYNLLIAVGAGLMATGGILARYISAEFLYVFLLAGIAVLFTGFLRSLEVAGATRQPRPAPASTE